MTSPRHQPLVDPRPRRIFRLRDLRRSRRQRKNSTSRSWCWPAPRSGRPSAATSHRGDAAAALAGLALPRADRRGAGDVPLPLRWPIERTVNVFDAFGLALFCVAGAIKALDRLGRYGGADGHGHRDRRQCSATSGRSVVIFAASSTRPRRWPAPRSCSASARTCRPSRWRWRRRGVCLVWRLLAIWRDWRAPDAHRGGQRSSVPRAPGAGRGCRTPGRGRAGRAARGSPRTAGRAGERPRVAGVQLAPVRAAVVVPQHLLHQGEVRSWSAGRCVWKAR